ncbi:MAG: rRNA maturation RNase YbeY [Alphaproteobacteria bacterium]|nr:rRNA maturation RNase YbeY [Alphaproteobacteria bacterium]
MIELDLRVEAPAWTEAVAQLEAVCQRALEAGAAVGAVAGEVSVLLTADNEIQALNRDWRGKDKPTDVLSFEADPMDRPFLGDIAVSIGVARRDAASRDLALDQHLSHLLIHGYLHLIGHDHIEDTDAMKMESLEVRALASLGWPDPYR